MLTPKKNSPHGDLFSGLSHRRTGEPAEDWGRKPLSHILRQARESRKLSLQEVARLTHIPVKSLYLLEGVGDERLVAEPLSLLASLRRYAAFLNLEPGRAVAHFIAELEKLPVAEEAAGGAHPTQLLKHAPRPQSRLLPRTILLLLVLGLLAVLGSYNELKRKQRVNEDKVVALPPPSAPAPASHSSTPPPASSPAPAASSADAGQAQPAAPPPAVSPPSAVALQAEPPAVATPPIASPVVLPEPQPQQSPGTSPHRLYLQAKEETWLRLTIDGQHTREILLHPSQSLEWSANRGFTLTLGNAGGVTLTLDGQKLPPFGKSGQVVRNLQLPSQKMEPRQQGRQSSERQAEEGFQSPSLAHQRPLSPFSGAPVSSAAVRGESAQAVGGSAKEQVQGLGEARERTVQGTALPQVDKERPKGGQTDVPDRDTHQAVTTRSRRGTEGNRPPHLVAASPPTPALEIAAGDVQRFSVKASDPDKDDRLAYIWFLDGQEVARGPTWEFRAPSPPPSETHYQVKVEVSDKGGLKSHFAWNLAVMLPSPLPRIVDAQPHDRKVVMQAGEALEFSVVAELAGGAQEVKQGLRYQWQVDDTPPQTTQTASFRFVDPTPAPHRVTVLAISPQGFKSTPKGWIVEVRPADVPPPSPDGATPSPSQREMNTPWPQAAPGADSQESGTESQPVAAPLKNDQTSSTNIP